MKLTEKEEAKLKEAGIKVFRVTVERVMRRRHTTTVAAATEEEALERVSESPWEDDYHRNEYDDDDYHETAELIDDLDPLDADDTNAVDEVLEGEDDA